MTDEVGLLFEAAEHRRGQAGEEVDLDDLPGHEERPIWLGHRERDGHRGPTARAVAGYRKIFSLPRAT
jgi:hypothetical protein